jgi:hypothetical protein
MEPSDYDEILLCKILYFVRGTGLLVELNRWGRTIGQKMVAVHEAPCAPNSTHTHTDTATAGSLMLNTVGSTVYRSL